MPTLWFPVVDAGISIAFVGSLMTRVFHFMSGHRITCATRPGCSVRPAHHMSLTAVASKMTRVSHVASGQRVMDVSRQTCRVQPSCHRCLASDVPRPVVNSDMSIPLVGSMTSCV